MKGERHEITCEIKDNKIAGADKLPQLDCCFELHDLMIILKIKNNGQKKEGKDGDMITI